MSDNTPVDQTTPAPAKAAKVEYTYVKSGLSGDDKDKVALNEYDAAHPLNSEGRPEVWVAGSDSPAQKVAKTPEVVRHIREGELVEVSEADAKKDAAIRDAKSADRRKAAFEAQHPEIAHGLAALWRPSGRPDDRRRQRCRRRGREGRHGGEEVSDEHHLVRRFR